METRFVALYTLGLLAVSAKAAVTLTTSGTAPAVGVHDEANLNAGATIPGGDFNSQAFSDNAGPPGQTFTTGTEADYLLDAFSFKGALAESSNYGGFTETTTWGIRVSTVTGTTLTSVLTVTGIPHPAVADGDDWYTWTLSGEDAVVLAPSTTYSFEAYSSTGWLGFDASDVSDAYAGGTAFNTTSTARTFDSTTMQIRDYDRTFVANVTVVPEPSTSLLLASVAAGGLMMRRRTRGVVS